MNMKRCSRCDQDKPKSEFGFKNKAKGILISWCKECNRAYQRQHYLNNKQIYRDKARAWEVAQGGKLMIKYGLSEEQVEVLLAKFDGLCWSCQKQPATVVDHDHSCCPGPVTCGKCFRGMLCGLCNRGIGQLGDTLEGVLKAAAYLQASVGELVDPPAFQAGHNASSSLVGSA